MNIEELSKNIQPKLVCNNLADNTKVLTELERCFAKCKSFSLSVAFISDSGLACLRQTLLNLRDKGIKGRIVTSTYLEFNKPEVFKQLLEFDNIEVRIFERNGFHPKGYIFEYPNEYKIIIGSSNLTQNALSINEEWNISLTSFNYEDITNRVVSEFETQWSNSSPLTQEWINEYELTYVEPIPRDVIKNNNKEIKPNKMQEEALTSLLDLRERGRDRALLISATGTGKTFLSAFDVKQFNPKRMLFVVHRENIAKKAMESFKRIMPNRTYGIFTGNKKEADADFIFSTIQTMGKQDYLDQFNKDTFDYIVVDEVHHVGAPTYNHLIEHFTPKFLLGMTATPERSDKFDIYKLFDYNIAYEIRLQQAMEYDLLCPFHYYGIADLQVNHESKDLQDFSKLEDEKRAGHIIKAINTYHHSGKKVHGLIFVSRVEEAITFSNIFNKKGYRTIALTGNDKEDFRQKAIDRLEMNEGEDSLDYIFTVDIFNEGVDIPSINQVIMVRPTESAIIFVQQLGRGLRKSDDKEYVNIIDIIGNYSNNFLIPIALSGNNSYNKDSLRRFLFDSNQQITGASTISFDDISRKRIYDAIDVADFSQKKMVYEAYKELKIKIGTIPTLMDFEKHGSLDPIRIFEAYGSYHALLKSKEKEYNVDFNQTKQEFLEFVSTRYATGKRVHELEAIKQVIINKTNMLLRLKKVLIEKYGIVYDERITKTLINELSQEFLTGSNRKKFQHALFIEKQENDYQISSTFSEALKDVNFYNEMMEIIELGIYKYYQSFTETYKETDLCLYQKYTYDDVCRLLNWEKSDVPLNIGGYKYDKHSNTFPVFINYEKTDVRDSINYEDRFIEDSNDRFIAISKSPRTKESDDMKTIINAKNNNTPIHLFIRKNKQSKDETFKEFYYLGTVSLDGEMTEFKMRGTKANAVEIPYKLDNPVREDILNYIKS